MSRSATIICFLLVVLALPVWLLMAGFSPALLDSASTMTKIQKRLGGALVTGIVLGVPAWVIFFGWRTIRGWRDGAAGSALLMALPALLMLGFIIFINFARTAP